MKTKNWVILLVVLLAVCGGLSLWLLGDAQTASSVEVWSDGELLYTLPLSVPRQITVESAYGTNVVTVENGAVAVTEADCPDHYCMKRGFCDGGVQIVCLPNRLVLKFVGEQTVDAVVG